MDLEGWKEVKKKYGYSYDYIAERSGVPVGTIQKIFTGVTQRPRYDTLIALESVFATAEKRSTEYVDRVAEEAVYQIKKQGEYTVTDYLALPDEQRVELIDGVFYDMGAPTASHQLVSGEVYRQIANYIIENGGDCTPFISPIDVQLDCDEKTMIQPDVAIVCDEEKLTPKRIYGHPDFVLETLSPSTRKKDCGKKLAKYMEAGVREYWILDLEQRHVLVYFFEDEVYPVIYGLDHPVPVSIYQGKLQIDFTYIMGRIDRL